MAFFVILFLKELDIKFNF